MRRLGAVVAAVWVGAASGCGIGRPEPEADPAEIALEAADGVRFYSERSEPGPLSREAAAAAGEGMNVAADGCLERAARILGKRIRSECGLWPNWFEEPALFHAGCPEGGADFVAMCGNSRREFLDAAARELRERPRTTRVGAAKVRVAWPNSAFVLLMAERPMEMDPFPKQAASGGLYKVSFRLSEGLEKPRLYDMRPDGSIEKLEILGGADEGYRGHFTSEERGTHWLEIMATGAEGPRVLALFPVHLDEDPPAAVRRPEGPEISAETVDQAERVLFEQLNRERRRRGIPTVRLDRALSDVARRWSVDMGRRGRIAHLDEAGRGPMHRAREGGLALRQLGEVLAGGSTVWEAHQALMESPAHRGAMLDPRYSTVGIGAAFRSDGSRRGIYVAEELAVPQRDLSPEDVYGEVIESIRAYRAKLDLPGLREGTSLSRAATELAERAAALPARGRRSFLDNRLAGALRRQGFRGAVGASLQSLSDPDELTLPRELEKGALGRFGIGIGRGRLDGGLDEWVVLLIIEEGR